MSRGVNKVILIGNLGKDPEMRYGASNVAVCKFPIATTESWQNRESKEKTERTEWHNIVCFRGLADISNQYLHKGSRVYIEGSLHSSSWEAPDGQKRYRTEIIARDMQMLSGRSDQGGASDFAGDDRQMPESGSPYPAQEAPGATSTPSGQPEAGGAPPAEDPDDDIPF